MHIPEESRLFFYVNDICIYRLCVCWLNLRISANERECVCVFIQISRNYIELHWHKYYLFILKIKFNILLNINFEWVNISSGSVCGINVIWKVKSKAETRFHILIDYYYYYDCYICTIKLWSNVIPKRAKCERSKEISNTCRLVLLYVNWMSKINKIRTSCTVLIMWIFGKQIVQIA